MQTLCHLCEKKSLCHLCEKMQSLCRNNGIDGKYQHIPYISASFDQGIHIYSRIPEDSPNSTTHPIYDKVGFLSKPTTTNLLQLDYLLQNTPRENILTLFQLSIKRNKFREDLINNPYYHGMVLSSTIFYDSPDVDDRYRIVEACENDTFRCYMIWRKKANNGELGSRFRFGNSYLEIRLDPGSVYINPLAYAHYSLENQLSIITTPSSFSFPLYSSSDSVEQKHAFTTHWLNWFHESLSSDEYLYNIPNTLESNRIRHSSQCVTQYCTPNSENFANVPGKKCSKLIYLLKAYTSDSKGLSRYYSSPPSLQNICSFFICHYFIHDLLLLKYILPTRFFFDLIERGFTDDYEWEPLLNSVEGYESILSRINDIYV